MRHNSMAAINRLLPAEILERVFHLLPPRDLRAVVLVCRWWREVGEAPALWDWVFLVDWYHSCSCMVEILESRRLQNVPSLNMWNVTEEHPSPSHVESVFDALLLMSSNHLKSLSTDGVNLSSVDPDVMAKAVNKMETVEIKNSHLTSLQMNRILSQSLVNTRLSKLWLEAGAGENVDASLQKEANQVIPTLVITSTNVKTSRSIFKSCEP